MPGSKSAAWLDGRMEAPPGAVMPSIYLERREPARNIQRFYAIIITPTLFGAWAMVREWGRIGQPGTVRKMGFATEGEAWAAGERWRRRKVKRGYRAVGKAAACASVAVRRCSALSAGPWLANVHSGYHGFMDGHRSAI